MNFTQVTYALKDYINVLYVDIIDLDQDPPEGTEKDLDLYPNVLDSIYAWMLMLI